MSETGKAPLKAVCVKITPTLYPMIHVFNWQVPIYFYFPASQDCSFVAHRLPKLFQKWKGFQFCARRAGAWVRSTSCAADQRQCASDLCVPGDELCPENAINVLSAQSSNT